MMRDLLEQPPADKITAGSGFCAGTATSLPSPPAYADGRPTGVTALIAGKLDSLGVASDLVELVPGRDTRGLSTRMPFSVCLLSCTNGRHYLSSDIYHTGSPSLSPSRYTKLRSAVIRHTLAPEISPGHIIYAGGEKA
jgi:hypothetical protein